MNIDGYTGLPALPENHYWELYEYRQDAFYSDGVDWYLAIRKRRRFWFSTTLHSITLEPEYRWIKKIRVAPKTYGEYVRLKAEDLYAQTFKLTDEDRSRQQWLGQYPPKSVINDGVTLQDLANDGKD